MRYFCAVLLLFLKPCSSYFLHSNRGFRDLSEGSLPGSCPVHYLPEPLQPLPSSVEEALKQLYEALSQQINTTSLPGLSASVSYRGQTIWGAGIGLKSKNSSDTIDTSTIFRIASISKVFVVIMVHQMWEKGLITSLDDEFSKYVPEFGINNPFGKKSITLRQMMSQLSGLPREAPCIYGSIKSCQTTSSDIYARLKEQSLILPPWTLPSYSNLAFALLGHGLANALSEMAYEDYVQKMILDPLEMTSTGFNITEDVMKRMAVGYAPNGSVAPPQDLGWLSPAGQMYSTVDDLAKLSNFLMSAYNYTAPTLPVLQKETIREMLLPLFLNPDGQTQFGTPWEMRLIQNYLVRRKGGNLLGYSGLFSFVPDLQLGVNILWSGATNEFNASMIVYDILIPALTNALASVQPKAGYPSKPSDYEGVYKANIGEVVAEILTVNNTLFLVAPQVVGVGLWYVNSTFSTLFVPPGFLSCIDSELNGIQGVQVYFQLNELGVALSFSIPGLLWGVTFVRE